MQKVPKLKMITHKGNFYTLLPSSSVSGSSADGKEEEAEEVKEAEENEDGKGSRRRRMLLDITLFLLFYRT